MKIRSKDILTEDGNAILAAIFLGTLVALGSYTFMTVTHNQSRMQVSRRFSFVFENLRHQAEAILSDPAACEAAFKGVALPTATPSYPKTANKELKMVLAPGEEGLKPISVGYLSDDGMLEVKDIRLVNAGGTPTKYRVEIVADKKLQALNSFGGSELLIRGLELVVTDSGSGTIESCTTMKITDAEWEKVCTSVGSHYDATKAGCVVCPNADEHIVGWTTPVSPICKSTDQVICETIGAPHATWVASSKTCFQCKTGFELLLAPPSVAPSCVDSVDAPSIMSSIGTTCPTGQTKKLITIAGVLQAQCG